MKRAVATVISAAAVVLLAASLAAQAPNFSGSWTPDADKNPAPANAGGGGGGRGGGRGGFGGGPMTITQDAKTFKVERAAGRNGAATPQVYNLDGSESKITMGQNEATATAKWDGSTLVITTKTANGENVAKYSMDGADLKVETTSPGRNGGEPTTRTTWYKKG